VIGRGRIHDHRLTLTFKNLHRGRHHATLLDMRPHRPPVLIARTTIVVT
jgi:hypothetical protein